MESLFISPLKEREFASFYHLICSSLASRVLCPEQAFLHPFFCGACSCALPQNNQVNEAAPSGQLVAKAATLAEPALHTLRKMMEHAPAARRNTAQGTNTTYKESIKGQKHSPCYSANSAHFIGKSTNRGTPWG